MTISAPVTPIPRPNAFAQFVNANGSLSEHGIQLLNSWYNFMVGMTRITPCNASGTNVVTLTPLTASPLIEGYRDYEIYGFVAANTSTGDMTATVVPKSGALATLNMYTDAATRATANDTVAGTYYLLIYASNLNSNAGGFVLK